MGQKQSQTENEGGKSSNLMLLKLAMHQNQCCVFLIFDMSKTVMKGK